MVNDVTPSSNSLLEDLQKQDGHTAIGSWDVDLIAETVEWSQTTREIHEVPKDYSCTLAEAFEFFTEAESKNLLINSFKTAAVANTRYDVTVKLTTYLGNQKWVRTIGIPVIHNHQCVRVYGVIQDVTDILATQQTQKQQKDFFETTFNQASVGMGVTNLQGKFIKVNPSLCKIIGYSETEMLNLTFKDITHPDDLAKSNTSFDEFKKGIRKTYSIEKRYLHKKGKTVYAMLSVSVIRDDHQKPKHFIAQITDITHRYIAEKKAKELLDVTADQNGRLLNFAHIVSHNLRSHSGNLSMLLDLLKTHHPEVFTNEFIPYIAKATEELTETITHLNQVVKVHTENKDKLEPLNLRAQLDKTLTVLAGTILDTHCKVHNTVPDNIIVNYVPAYLESVLLNLLSNALKYRAEDRTPEITLSINNTEEFYVLSVADNGLGIDLKTHKKKLFGMYKTFHKHPDSRGVGLFLTKNQIEAMQGKIEVESEVDKGTCFKIYFKKNETT